MFCTLKQGCAISVRRVRGYGCPLDWTPQRVFIGTATIARPCSDTCLQRIVVFCSQTDTVAQFTKPACCGREPLQKNKVSRTSWRIGQQYPLLHKPHAANPSENTWLPHGVPLQKRSSLNFSQFVEGRRWWPWAREGREAAYVFAGDEPCTGEKIGRASARFDVRQTPINGATIF